MRLGGATRALLVAATLVGTGSCLAEGPPWPPSAPDRDTDQPDGTTGGGTEGSSSSGSTATSTTGSSTSSSTGTTTRGSSSSSTGIMPPEFCGGIGDTGNSTGASGPWLELTQDGAIVMDGGDLVITCGAQGGVMFILEAYFGGFEAPDFFIPKTVQMDVPGFPTGPSGHFWYEEGQLDLHCTSDMPDGVLVLVIAPDRLADPLTLDGAGGTLFMSIETPEGEASFGADVTIVVPDDLWCL